MKYLGLEQEDYGLTPEYIEKARTFTPSQFSPDVARLDLLEFHRIFICDELMSTRRDFKYIKEEVVYKVVAFTADKFDFIVDPDGIALPIPSENGFVIKGELWIVRPKAIYEKLDKLRLNRVHFIRRRVDVVDPYRQYTIDKSRYVNNGYYDETGLALPKSLAGRKGTEYILGPELTWPQEAWMYLYNPDHWGYAIRRRPELFKRVPMFSPKKEKKWLSEYYYYQSPPKNN
jgi:hypothetical protein